MMSNGGFVKARMDYTAYGEDIGAGVGLRTSELGYSATSADSLRQRYGLTERDDAMGLDHTWFRKNENRGGRWTSTDPYNRSMSLGDPQSFNRYAYVANQPTNFIDPSGLLAAVHFVCFDIVDTASLQSDSSASGVHTRTICFISGGGPDSSGMPSGEEIGAGGGGGAGSMLGNCDAARTGNADLDEAAAVIFGESDKGNSETYEWMRDTLINRYRMSLKEFGCNVTDVLKRASSVYKESPEPFEKAKTNSEIKSLSPGRCEAFKKAQAAAQSFVDATKVSGNLIGKRIFNGSPGGNVPLFWAAGTSGDDPQHGRHVVGDTAFRTYFDSPTQNGNQYYFKRSAEGADTNAGCHNQ